MIEYLIGVDGGGTGTRVRIARNDNVGTVLALGSSGPSGLMHGAEQAWSAIMQALNSAFGAAGVMRPALERMAIGLGLAGVNNRQWPLNSPQRIRALATPWSRPMRLPLWLARIKAVPASSSRSVPAASEKC
ncbi:hypothetical protein [Collimonas arenae]|uniref:hypothetical protein n=1 Tax=Collimonas arenae TaxID=279058 RepID=UPI000ABEE365